MDAAISWFFDFMTHMLGGIWQMLSGLFDGFVAVFNFPEYINKFGQYSSSFGVIDWIVSILLFILVFAVWGIIFYLIVIGIIKLIKLKKASLGKEELLEELANLHRDVAQLTKEKERIMEMRIGSTNITSDEIKELLQGNANRTTTDDESEEDTENKAPVEAANTTMLPQKPRFDRLSAVDHKYLYYVSPAYRNDLSLEQICEEFRNFACSSMHLYYEIKTIRLMFAGLASTKLILLQGISGTGKTSLPYALGKFFLNPATITSVQPSWHDRTELFGYFNEFTKRYNETEFLKRVYEASYNDDINIVILDEMNIARVEYYFAEMLSILEMPDPSEWSIELVPSHWDSDPKKLEDGKLTIPQNVWYIGTANNDDSTFSVSDKVYDRALVINFESKGIAFDAPKVAPMQISYSHVAGLYEKAVVENPVSEKNLKNLSTVDLYIIEHFRVAFGNRIVKQLCTFVPVYVATGGTEVEGIDYVLATKIFRKFESLNLSLIKDEIDGLITLLNRLFGNNTMMECINYLKRLKKMY